MAKPINVDPRDIIQAARACIEQRGLSAMTLKDVAAEAGVTQGTIYYHFKTKEELLSRVIEQTIDEHLNTLDKIWSNAGDIPSKINSALESARDSYGKDKSFHSLFFSIAALSLHNQRAAEEFSRQTGKVVELLEKPCEHFLDSCGNISGTPEQMSRIIMAVVSGLALQSIFHRDMDIDGTYRCFEQMLQGLYLGGRKDDHAQGK